MNYIISLKGQEQEEIQISQKDYDTISKFLNQVRLFKLESGEIIDSSQIRRIKPLPEQQTISKEFRLPQAGESTAGKELRKINITEGMERLFNKLKSVGLFRDYKNYAQYTNRKI